MRADGGRAKKLIVAFHFQFAQKAAWKCDACRKSGLERTRRCGWLREGGQADGRPVWVRKSAHTTSCPVSYISGESLAWVEEFVGWKTLRYALDREMPARTAEALLLLEAEWQKEIGDGE